LIGALEIGQKQQIEFKNQFLSQVSHPVSAMLRPLADEELIALEVGIDRRLRRSTAIP
jgi:hypothetical protein